MSTPRPEDETRGPSPIAVFGILVVLVVLGAGGVLLTRDRGPGPTPATTPEGTPSPTDPSLTDAEAIAVFEELDRLRQMAYQDGDPRLLDRVFVPGSPPSRIARREIRLLRERRLVSRSRFETRSLEVVTNDPERIVLRQVALIRPRILAEDGADVADGSAPRKQTLRWVLTWAGDWLIADSVVVRSQVADP